MSRQSNCDVNTDVKELHSYRIISCLSFSHKCSLQARNYNKQLSVNKTTNFLICNSFCNSICNYCLFHYISKYRGPDRFWDRCNDCSFAVKLFYFELTVILIHIYIQWDLLQNNRLLQLSHFTINIFSDCFNWREFCIFLLPLFLNLWSRILSCFLLWHYFLKLLICCIYTH